METETPIKPKKKIIVKKKSPEKDKVKYGLVNNVNTFNPIKITFMGWQSMMQDIQKAKNYREVFSTIFGPPNTRNRSGSF